MTSTRLTIDLDAVAGNYEAIRRRAGAAEVAPVVKADGYGLGAEMVARRLAEQGAKTFFVARVSEGLRLRQALGAQATIYVLDGCPPGTGAALAAAGLRPVLNSSEQVAEFAHSSSRAESLCGALHIDTGMNRLGVRPQEAEALARTSAVMGKLKLTLVISHLARAAELDHPMNARQLASFRDVAALFPGVPASLSSSGGAFLGDDFLFEMVRPGISLYGGGPFSQPHLDIRPVATFEAPILQVRDLNPGETIGYGATFTANKSMRVAVVAAGYADGLLRSTSPKGRAWFDGAMRPLLGRVSMDLTAVDVTGCPTARAGEMVELLGPNILLDDLAEAAGTAAYEMLVRLGPRAERVYLGGPG